MFLFLFYRVRPNNFISHSNYLFILYLLILSGLRSDHYDFDYLYTSKSGKLFHDIFLFTLAVFMVLIFFLFLYCSILILLGFIKIVFILVLFIVIAERISIDFTQKTSQCHVSLMNIF